MEDEHLDTILEMESDELIKSSVEDLVHTPSESDGISEGECNFPICDDSSPKKDEVFDDIISIPPRNGNDHFNAESSPIEYVLNRDNVMSSPKIDLLIVEFAGELALLAPIPPGIRILKLSSIPTMIYDDSYEDIDYVDASPPDSELGNLEVVEIVIPEVGGIDTDILLTIKDDILRKNLFNVNLLIANIEALKDNPTPSFDFWQFTARSDYSLLDYEAFYDHIEEKSSGSTTTQADFSQYDSFIFDLSIDPFPPANRSDVYYEQFAGELAHIISPPEYDCFYFKNEPDQVNFMMDVVEDIFDNPTREPRVHVPNVLPTHPTLHLHSDFTLFMIDTFLPFSSKNENKVGNTGILASKEKSHPSSSHRGFKASKLSHHKSPMLIHGDNTPNLGVRHLHFYPP
ncbi:hypothetical protein Tco_1307604 [Tanacetum coccineum]